MRARDRDRQLDLFALPPKIMPGKPDIPRDPREPTIIDWPAAHPPVPRG
jgi:hypothetical protein